MLGPIREHAKQNSFAGGVRWEQHFHMHCSKSSLTMLLDESSLAWLLTWLVHRGKIKESCGLSLIEVVKYHYGQINWLKPCGPPSRHYEHDSAIYALITFIPSGAAMITALAIPTKNPCSTTPTTSRSSFAAATGSAMGFVKVRSTM